MRATDTKWHTKSGFEILFKKHYSALCAYCYGFVADYSLSEDIVQEVFSRLWTDKRKIKIDSSVKAYLYSAVRNTALNDIKHQKVKREYEKLNNNGNNYTERSIEDQVVGEELNAKIQSAINNLPTERRRIFLMSRMDELKYKEIAEKLDISIKTVENQMGKALASLRKDLSGEFPLVLFNLIFKAQKIMSKQRNN
ncbi:RNA polymerase sigma-70 factor [Maribellus maritimus]|uniref:RNA polymerase sigma-70 factor n=1 Tax=Maribellus maritimus TaxID=2870838 RepID=UPI001EE9C70B|nr:RNA polymerase sigma-70 factor [Maribellus maritimus]MCG6191020.1 RNA polymerase sigma-70 factor [Maribellus maritimus]